MTQLAACTPPLTVYVDGIGLLGPGLPDWRQGAVPGRQPALRDRSLRVAAARWRCHRPSAGASARGQGCAGRRLRKPCGGSGSGDALPSVFSSSSADDDNCHEICNALASERPADFADPLPQLGAQRPRGLLEHRHRCDGPVLGAVRVRWQLRRRIARGPGQVLVARNPVLLIAYDTAYPEPLYRVRPDPRHLRRRAAALPRTRGAQPGGIDVESFDGSRRRHAWPIHGSRPVRTGHPAARGLPLLMALARRRAASAGARLSRRRRLAVTSHHARSTWTRSPDRKPHSAPAPHVPAGRRAGMGRHTSSAARAAAISRPTIRSARTAGSVRPAASNTRHRPWPCMARCWRKGRRRRRRPAAHRVSDQRARRHAHASNGSTTSAALEIEAQRHHRRRQHRRLSVHCSRRRPELLSGRAAVVLDSDIRPDAQPGRGRHRKDRMRLSNGRWSPAAAAASGRPSAGVWRPMAVMCSSTPTATGERAARGRARIVPQGACRGGRLRRHRAAADADCAATRCLSTARSRCWSTMPASTTTPCFPACTAAVAPRHRRFAATASSTSRSR